MPLLIRAGVVLVFALLAAGVRAQSAPAHSLDAQIISSDSFLSGHPDLYFRTLGQKAFRAQKYDKALVYFTRAARYADKPSQAMVAEIHWYGRGVDVNRPLAYAWMDLAAERQFKLMLVHRERFWEAMSASERDQALALGVQVYADYADKVAKPRLERQLRIARTSSVGSRTGHVGAVKIIIPGPSGEEITLDGSQYYQDKYWKPKDYWAWQAEDWKELPKGRVNVGPFQDSVLK